MKSNSSRINCDPERVEPLSRKVVVIQVREIVFIFTGQLPRTFRVSLFLSAALHYFLLLISLPSPTCFSSFLFFFVCFIFLPPYLFL